MKRIKLKENDNYKIYAMSDIHGHYHVLEKALDHLHLDDSDYLLIIGDFINKGKDSLKTFLRIQELGERERTIIMKGNHELNMEFLMRAPEHFEKNAHLIEKESYETILHSLLREDKKLVSDFETLADCHAYLDNVHGESLAYFSDLPIIVENEDFVFVHGGYDPSFDLDSEEHRLLKYDDYYHQGSVNEKTVVVGHWPVSNLRHDTISNHPLLHEEKKILSIDGGLGVKDAGELTLLCIEKKDGEIQFTSQCFNHFPTHRVCTGHRFSEDELVYVNYPHFELELLEEGEDMSRVRHCHSGITLNIFTSMLNETEDGLFSNSTYLNRFLSLEEGDIVELVRHYQNWSLVKHEDTFGWIKKEQVGDEIE